MGCSTNWVFLNYRAPTETRTLSALGPVIAAGPFADNRGDDAKLGDNGNWFGAIRGGYGQSFKTLLTDEPISNVVAKAFADGLKARGLLAEGQGGVYLLSGALKNFACKQYVRRDCIVRIYVVVNQRSTQREVFSKTYETSTVDGSLLTLETGPFGSVDKLKELAAKTLSTTVDKALDDPALMNVTQQSPKPVSTNPPQTTEQRLQELKRLLDQGLISRDEYKTKRAKILNNF